MFKAVVVIDETTRKIARERRVEEAMGAISLLNLDPKKMQKKVKPDFKSVWCYPFIVESSLVLLVERKCLI